MPALIKSYSLLVDNILGYFGFLFFTRFMRTGNNIFGKKKINPYICKMFAKRISALGFS